MCFSLFFPAPCVFVTPIVVVVVVVAVADVVINGYVNGYIDKVTTCQL